MPIRFPDLKGDAYEDLLVAILFSHGFFVEANLHLRSGGREVLELDVVATPVEDPIEKAILLDAKSGKSGIADLFKIYGWKQYLGIPLGCIVRTNEPDEVSKPVLLELSLETAVTVVAINDHTLPELPFVSVKMPDAVRTAILKAGWFGRIGKRLCIAAFESFVKSSQMGCAAKLKEYRNAIEQSFFKRAPLDRAKFVYSAYQTTGPITHLAISELTNGDSDKIKTEWNGIRELSHRPWLQFVLMMEHTARLRVVKNALLHVLLVQKQNTPYADVLLDEWAMPTGFQRGVNVLRTHRHRERIPLLWQMFIENFGAFYCLKSNCDLIALSDCTGIPANDVVECLELYGTFFPNSKGWFMQYKDEIRVFKNVPAAYHGTGVFLRSDLFGFDQYSKHCPTMRFLLEKWHNALYEILEPELKIKEAPR